MVLPFATRQENTYVVFNKQRLVRKLALPRTYGAWCGCLRELVDKEIRMYVWQPVAQQERCFPAGRYRVSE